MRTPVGKAIGAMIAVWVGFIVFSLDLEGRDLARRPADAARPARHRGLDGQPRARRRSSSRSSRRVGEELLFRGYIFRALRNWRGFAPAAIITGLIFGAVHIGSSPIGYALPLAAFGFGLCLLYQWTGSLYPCIALHALNNAFALGHRPGLGLGDPRRSWSAPSRRR